MDLDIYVARLKLLKANHLSQRYALEDQIIKYFPQQIKSNEERIKGYLTYTSNAIEGNSLTLAETKVLLEDGITVGGKPIKDCYEATGHAAAC
jgi:Fic family protein